MDTTKYKFHKLTPIRDAKLNVYEDSLDYVFRDNDLKNVAITGPYSSGKSSMLETYKTSHSNKRFIHISLAHFETATNTPVDNAPTDNKKEFEADIKAVEGKILNQLIHQIDTKEIPQTHFKIKRPFPKNLMVVSAVVVTAFLVMMIFLFNKSTWISFVNGLTSDQLRYALKFSTSEGFVIAILGTCILISLYAIYSLLKLQHNKNILRKLSVQGNEIEIFENDEDSFFDKHLNEVLYLFRHTEADAIVFEDMDRYNSNQIFEKLREINYLLNNSPDNPDNKVYRFFYLLRDDIFTSKDRTKFFDFIIPIVPVIDAGNSYDKLIEYFRDGGILDSFDGSFLQELSTYIDDMRLLKNIYNEYRIYHERIQGTELSNNKLLGIIAYKNLFPRDFSELQLGKGYVFCLFRNKQLFISQELNNIEEQISEINIILDNCENELLMSIDELDLLYFKGGGYVYDINGMGENSFPTPSKFIRAMRENPSQVFRKNNNYGRHSVDVTPFFQKMQEDDEYIRRKTNIENKKQQKKSILLQKLHQSNSRKKELENATLSEIIQISRETANTVFASTYTDEIGIPHEYKDVKGSLYFPLIKYLIRYKYIDENYPDYMSYFYEQSISRTDQIFVRSVYDVESKPFTYALKDSALVASKINSRYYSQPEVLNFDLFAFILASNNDNLPVFLEQICSNHRIDFLIEFWRTDREKAILIQNINKTWPTIWYEMYQKDDITIEDKNKYLVDTFYYSSHDEIKMMNIGNAITTHISSCTDFLSIYSPKVSLIAEALEMLMVRFDKISYDVSDKLLFNEVYSRNLYKINQSMIYLILNKKYLLSENEDFFHKNYSLLRTRPNEPIVNYIEANMDDYIGLVCEKCEGKITDDEINALAILNHSDVSTSNKEKYINALSTEVQELGTVEDNHLWPLLLNQHLVPCSKTNILTYYIRSEKAFDQVLTDFINASELEQGLAHNSVVANYGIENASAFYKCLITNNDLNNEKYRQLLSNFGASYSNFRFEGINNDKLAILIKLKIIKMNLDNLMFVRDKYAACKMKFILANINEYAQNTINNEEGVFSLSELRFLLKENISDQNLLKLLTYTDMPISISGVNLSVAVKKHIIINNYHEDDLTTFISEYENASPEIKIELLALFTNEVERIIDTDAALPYNLLLSMLNSSNLSSKERLFASQITNLSQEHVIECLKILKMRNLLTVFDGKWPSIEITDTNTLILDAMKSKKWISSFSENKHKDGYYQIRARRNNDRDDEVPSHLL